MSLEKMGNNQLLFCEKCGRQFTTIDELEYNQCHECQTTNNLLLEEETFFCWACGKHLISMSEIAQGVCHQCKFAINRKINPLILEKIVHLLLTPIRST